ncbi:MAG TPA: CGNR zinc finger domain-containing protein [Candidatus Sulfomarinibacteraceae bacterium]|nr:CGNR zinc finger domain-containing protein [Candidatus Sulfomarinibacteraceae bacterium]
MTITPAPDHHHHELDLEAALEFLNTRELESGQLVDRLVAPAHASAWFVDQGVVHPTDVLDWADDELARVRAVRDALREVVDAVVEDRAPDAGSLDLVNEALASGSVPRLEIEGSTVWVGHRHGARSVDAALAALAEPIVLELESGRPDRFRTCANDTCRWAFYDTSPTGRRRWCDMKTCGNRAKAARHRQRARAETPPSGPPAPTRG